MKTYRGALHPPTSWWTFGILGRGILIVACALIQVAAYADKPPEIPAWHDGGIVFFTAVNENVDGPNAPHSAEPAIPFYVFPPELGFQLEVLAGAPEHAGYNPWWEVFVVIVTDGRDVTTDPFTSEAEILEAVDLGNAFLVPTGFVFLCQVLPGANR